MRKLNNYTCLGLFINGIWLFSQRSISVPEFISGLCAGIGITLIFIGAYAENNDISKLNNFKRKIFKTEKV